MLDRDPTPEDLDEHVRRLLQISTTDPAVLTDADLEALSLAHREGCVRMAAAELLKRREQASLEHTLRCAVRDLEAELKQARARITELEWLALGSTDGSPLPLIMFTQWLVGGQRGLSADALVSALTGRGWLPGGAVLAGTDWPTDASDFWRCENLLQAVPEAREHLSIMNHYGPEWTALVQHWDELSRLDRGALAARIAELTGAAHA